MENSLKDRILTVINPYQTGISESLKRWGGGKMACRRKMAVWAMFFSFKEHKPYQGTLGILEVILIRSRTRSGPSMDHKVDVMIFKKIPGSVYHFCIIPSLALLDILEHFLGAKAPLELVQVMDSYIIIQKVSE